MYLLGKILLLVCGLVSLVFLVKLAITDNPSYWILVTSMLMVLRRMIESVIKELK